MSDLISRADAIEAVRKEYEDAINIGDNGDAIAYDVGRILSALPSAEAVQGWIPCSERLPKDLEPVNATWVNHNPPCYYMDIMNVPFTGTCVRYKGKWYWWDSTICDALGEYGEECGAEPIDKYIEITAWQPLPTPYEGGDTE